MSNSRDLYSYFLNDYLVKLNQYNRLGIKVNSKSAVVDILSNHKISKIQNIKYRILYNSACLINLFMILISKKYNLDSKEIFIYSDLRHLSKRKDEAEAMRICLYNFRNISNKHIISTLSTKDQLYIVFISIFRFMKDKKCLIKIINDKNINKHIYLKLTGINIFRYLDLQLSYEALKQSNVIINFSSHFAWYVNIVSELTKNDNKISYGYQHGLYEFAPEGYSYQKFYNTTYTLMFNESKKYFNTNLNGNEKCVIKTAFKPMMKNLEQIENKLKKIICYAMQNDDIELDCNIISKILSTLNNEFILIIYLHPATSLTAESRIKELFPETEILRKTRYSNIDLIITRYSTTGIEYAMLDKNICVHYLTFLDKVCISEAHNNQISFHYNINDYIDFIKEKLLNLRIDSI